MKSIKPIVFISFLFFAAVAANDFTEPEADYEVSDLEDSDDMLGEDFGYDAGENEDIIYSRMISAKPVAKPPRLPSSPILIKSPPSSFTPTQPPVCKKWRCRLNGYTPIWVSYAPTFCTQNYGKLSWQAKAKCQDDYCQKTCVSF